MTGISLQSLKIVEAWGQVARRVAAAEGRLNGRGLPPTWDLAIAECRAAAMTAYRVDPPAAGSADATALATTVEPPAPLDEEVGVAEASRRLGISGAAIRKRIAHKRLDARKLGGIWLVTLPKETTNG